MKAMQYKTGLDPENIAYYFKDESNNNKLRIEMRMKQRNHCFEI